MTLNRRQKLRATIPGGMVCLFLAMIFGGGCTANHYRKKADHAAYQIIQNVENEIFGSTNEFSINTRYSHRDPDEIPPEEIIDDRLTGRRRTLSLNEALELGAHQSRRYQAEKERLYLTALSLTGDRHEFGPQFFGSVGPQFNRFPSTENQRRIVDNGFGPTNITKTVNIVERNGTVSTRVGFTQMLKSGGSIGVSLANDLLRYYTGSPRESAVTIISADLVQPILRGFGKNNPALENLKQAERNVIYAVRSYSFFQNQFAIDVVNDYFNLLAQKNIISNNYSNYLGQVQSTKRLEARAVDRESINSLDLARQSELSAKNSYINSIASYFNSLDAFKIELGIPLNERLFLDDSELEQLQDIGLIAVDLDANKAYRLAAERQLEILNSIDEFEDAKRKVHVAADQLKPGLSLFANADLESDRPTDYSTFEVKEIRYSAGVDLELPLDRLSERNSYRSILIAFETQLRNLALDLDNLKDSIDRGLRTLEQRRQNYIIQKNALELANRRVLSNQLLLQAGRSEVRDLVEAQNAQIQAQNAVTVALVSYQEIRLQLLQNIGLLETQSADFWFKSHLDEAPDIAATANTLRDLPRDTLPNPAQIFSN